MCAPNPQLPPSALGKPPEAGVPLTGGPVKAPQSEGVGSRFRGMLQTRYPQPAPTRWATRVRQGMTQPGAGPGNVPVDNRAAVVNAITANRLGR